MVIQLKTEKAKKLLFGNLQTLRGNIQFSHLKFNHDRTDEEKNKAKDMMNKAEQKNKEAARG